MQLAATDCRHIIIHVHYLLKEKYYLCIRMGIHVSIFKIFIWGGISSYIGLTVTSTATRQLSPNFAVRLISFTALRQDAANF